MPHSEMARLMHSSIARLDGSIARKQAMLVGFDPSHVSNTVYIRTRLENDIHADIVEALGERLCIEVQFKVGRYRVDMYVRELNVVVECDENDHNAYNADAEKARQDYISGELGCRWVRYNPYAADFTTVAIIRRILSSLVIASAP